MPVATAPLGVGRAPAPVRHAERARPPLRVVDPPRQRRPRPTARRLVAVSIAVAVGSLLLVAAADAYLTQGQVRLTRIQQQLNTELGRHHDLELRAAQRANPGAIVAGAQQHGMQAPGQVADIPLVSTPPPSPTTTVAPAAPTAPAVKQPSSSSNAAVAAGRP